MFGWKFQNKANQNPIKRLFTTIFYKSKNVKYFFLTYINVFNEIYNRIKTIMNLNIKESPVGIRNDTKANNNSINIENRSSLIEIAPLETLCNIM